MSVYKEAIHAVKEITNKSRQIYPDAYDFGTPCKKGDNIWNLLKQLVDWYGVPGTRRVSRYSTGATVVQDVEYMLNEHSSDEVQTVRVTFVTTPEDRKMDGYVYLEFIS